VPTLDVTPQPPLLSTVPAGVQVVYHWSNADVAPGASGLRYGNGVSGTTVLHATDWSGRDAGRIIVPGDGSTVIQSPDGEELYVVPNVYASDGHWVGALPEDAGGGNTFGPMWADDSRHLCKITTPTRDPYQSSPPALVEYTPNQPERVVQALPGDSRADWQLLACSTATDRAVLHLVTFSGGTEVVDRLLVVRLSDGRQLLQRDQSRSSGVSPDGMLSMETNDAGVAVIRDFSTGAVTSTGVHGDGEQLSADGTRILISLDAPGGTMAQTQPGLVVVDVKSGRIVWRAANSGTIFGFTLARPVSGDLAIAGADHHPNTGYFPSGPVTLYLVAANGRAVIAARDIERIPAG
jgi:hypothetical protein